MLIAYNCISATDKLKGQLPYDFEIKDLGEVKIILGMEIERDRVKEKVSLTQKVYLQKVLQKFNIGSDTKSVSIPLAPHSSFQLRCLRRQWMSVSTVDTLKKTRF